MRRRRRPLRARAARHDEADGDVGGRGFRELLAEVGEEGVVLAPGDEAGGGCGAFGQVVALAGDDVPHTATGVGDVVLVARDQVDVEMEDGLPRGFADVDADVVAVGVVAAGDQVSAAIEAGGDCRALVGGGVEPGRDVPARNDEEVARVHREGVPEGPREAVFEGDAVLGGEAEGALGGCGHGAVVCLFVLRVISSVPSRPAATQAAQRQAFTGRRACRLDWQTGHQWS